MGIHLYIFMIYVEWPNIQSYTGIQQSKHVIIDWHEL